MAATNSSSDHTASGMIGLAQDNECCSSGGAADGKQLAG